MMTQALIGSLPMTLSAPFHADLKRMKRVTTKTSANAVHLAPLVAEWQGTGTPGGHNFAVLFPLWDMLFGTARFDGGYRPTGVPDQLQGRDYGRGFWAQQWRGLRRLAGR
jgi:hypothetical protein